MFKHLQNIGQYIQYKILAGAWAVFWTDDLPRLFLLFVGLELMDIFTRWIALSFDWFKKTYPQTPCNLWTAVCWMWQARKWRWIKSTGLRDGFCDKMLTYLLLLLMAALVDGALLIVHIPARVLLTIVTVVLATTEGLSIIENLGECGVAVVGEIKRRFVEKINKL